MSQAVVVNPSDPARTSAAQAEKALSGFAVNVGERDLDLGVMTGSGMEVSATLPDGSNAKGQWGYYKKRTYTPEGDEAPDAGYIFIGSTHPTDVVNYIEMGHTPLRKYGMFTMQQKGWDPNKEPYRLLFIRGGADEFPLAQIVEHRWHIRPPYRNVHFRELEKVRNRETGKIHIPESTCSSCRQKRYALTQAEADFLIGKHQSVWHQQTNQSEQLARNIATVTTEMQGPMAEVLKSILKGQQDQQAVNAGLIQALSGLSEAIASLRQPVSSAPTPTPVKPKPEVQQ